MCDLSQIKNDFFERVKSIAFKANILKSSFDQYSYLWKDDRKECMEQFLTYNHFLTHEEKERLAESPGCIPELVPTMENFKKMVISN